MRGVRPVFLCFAVVVAAFEVRAESADAASGDDGIADYESLYLSAVESYLSGHWAQCVSRLKTALAAYRTHVGVVVGCRTKCRAGGKTGDECATSSSAFYIAQAAEAHCLRKCTGPWDRVSISEATIRDFRERLPYNYLQRCYFELGDTKAAATAAYTFLESNPGHSLVVFHLSQYLEESGLSNRDVASLENNEYQPPRFCPIVGELQKACEATQSYLLLLPDDADMWYNQAFYARLPSTQDSWFKARKVRQQNLTLLI
ncbi:hypothetical protein V5799_014591 [Amblyomma americanum]|uniref:Leprecan-like alpha-helical domain-containing protein n=1 Tax=Amblyomma americanum TaxID=6943 RepID=A0AAQ4E2K6_AMBAM